jgi:hypothetical protein
MLTDSKGRLGSSGRRKFKALSSIELTIGGPPKSHP